MTQTEARQQAKLYNNQYPWMEPHVATTVCAARGQFEQGPDAEKWVVVSGDIVVMS